MSKTTNEKTKPCLLAYDGCKANPFFDKPLDRMFKALANKGKDYTVVETCAGACGILPPFYDDFRPHIEDYILSDFNSDINTLYWDVVNNHDALIVRCTKFADEIESAFRQLQIWLLACIRNIQPRTYICHITQHKITRNMKTMSIERYFKRKILPLAVKGCSSVRIVFEHAVPAKSKVTMKKRLQAFREKISNIEELHGYLWIATIPKAGEGQTAEEAAIERDLLYLIRQYRNTKNVLFLVDPPYYLTKVYKNNTPDHLYHEILIKELFKVNGHGYFALFFRINASREHNSKDNDLLDDALFLFYKDHLYGKGLYVYCDDFSAGERFINLRSKGTYEVIVTNFEYQNTHPLEEVFDEYKKKIRLECQSKPKTSIAQELGIED